MAPSEPKENTSPGHVKEGVIRSAPARKDDIASGVGPSRLCIQILLLIKSKLGPNLFTPSKARRRARASKSELALRPKLRTGRRFCGQKMNHFSGLKIRPQIEAY